MVLGEVHDCGGNRVLALLHQSGKPHGSDSKVHLQYGLLHTVRAASSAASRRTRPPRQRYGQPG